MDEHARGVMDRLLMDMVNQVASESRDRSTKVGCVIVDSDNQILSTGFNGFAAGVDTSIDERYARPLKYKWTEHAERNAIYRAAKEGVSLTGSTMYLSCLPCCDCARAIIQSGIVSLKVASLDLIPNWEDDQRIALTMLSEAGVSIVKIAPSIYPIG